MVFLVWIPLYYAILRADKKENWCMDWRFLAAFALPTITAIAALVLAISFRYSIAFGLIAAISAGPLYLAEIFIHGWLEDMRRGPDLDFVV